MKKRLAFILRTAAPAAARAAKAALFAAAMLFAAPVLAQDLSVAGGKVAVCGTCHGVAGKSDNPLYPHLAGQHEEYLVKSLTAYRDGDRQDALMSPMAVGLTDEEIAELAAFYAAR